MPKMSIKNKLYGNYAYYFSKDRLQIGKNGESLKFIQTLDFFS